MGVVLYVFADRIPEAFATIFARAFSPTAATGGFVGSTVMMAIQKGVARGIFSNEAGSAPPASPSRRRHPRSGVLGPDRHDGHLHRHHHRAPMTGLAIMVSGVWTSGATGAVLSAQAFEAAMPGVGNYLLAVSLTLFAFTTILGWCYHSEKCWSSWSAPRRKALPHPVDHLGSLRRGAQPRLRLAGRRHPSTR